MANLNYLDFELCFEQHDSGYRVKVLRSPVDEQASVDFKLPFISAEQAELPVSAAKKRHLMHTISPSEMSSPKKFGRLLFETIFRDDVLICMRSSMTIAESKNQGRLRIRLNFSATPELIDLPWEYLFDPKTNRFLCLSLDTPLVRYLEVPGQIQPLAVKPPLRVLVIITSPIDLPLLNVELEWQRIQSALKDLVARKLIILERLQIPTLVALQDTLRQKAYQVLHFIGHSSFDAKDEQGVLVFEDEDKYGQFITGERLGTILHDAKMLRLVILNACSSAKTTAVDPFSGVSQLLLQQGIPAVIAMQFDVTDQAAIIFAHTFYKALASSYPVDAALAEARKAIATQNNDIEWGTPVLYMRAVDGQLFDIAQPRIPVRIIIAILGLVFGGIIAVAAVQTDYCREQLIDTIMRRQLPSVHNYIERARAYRDQGYLVCAKHDFESAFIIAKDADDRDRLYYGLATVALADLELTTQLLEQVHAWSQEGLRDQVTEPFLYLSDGLALCQLHRTDEAIKQIERFMKNQVASTEIQNIHRDLIAGIDVSFDCRIAALDLP